MQKLGDAPELREVGSGPYGLVAWERLTDVRNGQPGCLERAAVHFDGTVLDPKDESFVDLTAHHVAHPSCVLAHVERLVRIAVDEQAAGEDRMQDRSAEHAARDKNPGKLPHRPIEVLNVQAP